MKNIVCQELTPEENNPYLTGSYLAVTCCKQHEQKRIEYCM